jgi:hypothetical protein
MKQIFSYTRKYFSELDKKIFALTSFFIGGLIFLNYYFGIDSWISNQRSFTISFLCRWGIFLIAFILPYFFYRLLNGKKYFNNSIFILLIILAPAIFGLKVALNIPLQLHSNANWNDYWNHIFYWPLLLLMVIFILFVIWKTYYDNESFFGATFKNFKWKPYLLMLLLMVPLIAVASTQPDFLDMYPKLQLISGVYHETDIRWYHKLLFELSYGSDFIGIELFFRGFLVLAFVKWAGKDAILPMACFYCTIHFGKPLGECISSYFGGMILGVVVYHTRSIFGGLIVHLGIAWLMEIGGYIGNYYW